MLILMNVSFTTMKQREHDIGVMKAIGLGGQVGSFFVAEGLILSVTGCALGVLTGAIAYLTYTYLLVGWGYTIRFLLPTLLFAGIFATSTLLSFIFLYFPMYRAFSRLRAAEAISGSSSSKTRIFAGMLKPLERLGLNFKLAVRSVAVRGWEPHRMMGCLAISMMLVTTIALGGQIIQYTTSRYVERGIGENLILISHPEVGTRYIDLLSPVPRVETTTFDFTAQAYQIDKTLIRWLESEPTVDLVDPRIVTTSRIFEVQYVKPIPGPTYQTIGDDRSANVLVLGVKAERVSKDFVGVGRFFGVDDRESVVVGDSLLGIVYDTTVQKIRAFGSNFGIVGVCIDPLNGGYTVYMPYETLGSTLNIQNPNVVLARVSGGLGDRAADGIIAKAGELGLGVYDLNPVVRRNIAVVETLWSAISFLPSLMVFATTLCLLNYVLVTVSGRISDIKVMRAVGARWRRILGVILSEVLLITLGGGLPGLATGWVVSTTILLPSPTVPPFWMLVLDLILFLGVLMGLSMASLMGADRALRRLVKQP